MGYRLKGIDKNGKKIFEVNIEQGKDIFGKRQRYHETFHCSVAEIKIIDAELTKKYYHKGSNANVKSLKFEEYCKIYLDKYCKGNIGLTTINNYKRLLRNIIPFIGNYKLVDITPSMLDNMYNKLRIGTKGKELSYNSMYDYYKIINALFNQAIKWEFIDKNPNKKARKPKKEIIERNYYDMNQVNKLLSCLEKECIKNKALITLALDSGARRGEIVALKWSDIDFEKCTLKIDNSLKVVKGVVDEKSAKTNSSNRVIILSQATIDIMKEYKEWQNKCIFEAGNRWKEENRIFTSKDGNYMHPSTCYRIFMGIINKYNLEHIRFHDLRHTSASVLIHEGINLKAVSQRLGHSNINITSEIYAHTFESDKQKSALKFDEIIKNV